MPVTKYAMDRETLSRIAEDKLGSPLRSFRELTAGLCNALYCLETEDGRETVLKVADPDKTGMRRGEQWLMESELAAMDLVSGIPEIPVPAVLVRDFGGELCPAPYFIMEFVPGRSMGEMARGWTPEEKDVWYGRIGRLGKRIASVGGTSFGILASGRNFRSFPDFFSDFFSLLLADADEGGIDLGVPAGPLVKRLGDARTAMEEVTEPCLVHYDLWENNLIVRDGEIAGVLDWERAMWADPLMEERFRNYAVHPAFLEGYGKTAFSASERERCLWYDMAMDAALMIEVFFRRYADTRQYERAKGRFLKAWEKLNGIG